MTAQMKLSLAIQTPEVDAEVPVALLSGTFHEKAAKAHALGADGLELMTAEPAMLDIPDLQRHLQAQGLVVSAVGSGAAAIVSGLTLLDSDRDRAGRARERLHELIRFAAQMQAPLVTIGSFRGRLSTAGSNGRARLAAILREAAELAAEHGIRLAIEPLNRYEADLVNTAEQGLAFLDEIGHGSVGLLLDTFHANIEEKSWSEPFQRAMRADKLWHVHIGDNNRLPPGQGMIDFAKVIAILGEIGYDGFLSAELLGQPDPDTAAKCTMARMRALLEQQI
ncbi:MAG: sugar phosphate isomerase/epimerase family protein [Anaerolineales bacterium]